MEKKNNEYMKNIAEAIEKAKSQNAFYYMLSIPSLMLLLLARKYNKDSLFHEDFLPLDMFKIILRFTGLYPIELIIKMNYCGYTQSGLTGHFLRKARSFIKDKNNELIKIEFDSRDDAALFYESIWTYLFHECTWTHLYKYDYGTIKLLNLSQSKFLVSFPCQFIKSLNVTEKNFLEMRNNFSEIFFKTILLMKSGMKYSYKEFRTLSYMQKKDIEDQLNQLITKKPICKIQSYQKYDEDDEINLDYTRITFDSENNASDFYCLTRALSYWGVDHVGGSTVELDLGKIRKNDYEKRMFCGQEDYINAIGKNATFSSAASKPSLFNMCLSFFYGNKPPRHDILQDETFYALIKYLFFLYADTSANTNLKLLKDLTVKVFSAKGLIEIYSVSKISKKNYKTTITTGEHGEFTILEEKEENNNWIITNQGSQSKKPNQSLAALSLIYGELTKDVLIPAPKVAISQILEDRKDQMSFSIDL